MLSTEQVYLPITSEGCIEIIRTLSYLAVTPSLRYWIAEKVSFMLTTSPSLVHTTFVGGDPDEEQFKVKTVVEASCSDKILMEAVNINFEHHSIICSNKCVYSRANAGR